MVLPIERNVDLPLLKVLADGGQLPMSTAIDNVTTFFPKITQEDKFGTEREFETALTEQRWMEKSKENLTKSPVDSSCVVFGCSSSTHHQ